MATKKTAEKSAAKTPAKKTAPAKAAAKKTVKATPAPKTSSTSKTTAPHHDIARLAHQYYTERGNSHGQHVDDWLRAEKELNS